MRRNWMIGVGISILVAASLLAVGIGAYNAGQRHGQTVEVVTTTAGETAGQTVLVPVDAWRGWGWHGPGFGFGFLFFPLIIVGVILLISSRRRAYGGWRGGWDRGCAPEGELEAWHRRAHSGDTTSTPPSASDGT